MALERELAGLRFDVTPQKDPISSVWGDVPPIIDFLPADSSRPADSFSHRVFCTWSVVAIFFSEFSSLVDSTDIEAIRKRWHISECVYKFHFICYVGSFTYCVINF